MRCLILGGGAVGQFFAARLAGGGHDAVILARSEQAQALDERGITLHEHGKTTGYRIQAASDPTDTRLGDPFELAIVAVKSYATAEAARTLSGLRSCAGATILAPQNGVGNEEQLAQALAEECIVAGALTVAVDRVDSASVAVSNRGGLCVAPLGSSPNNWLIAALSACAMKVRAVPDWRALKWSKLCINLLGNGVCAALDWLPEQVYADRVAFSIEHACLTEAISVLGKLGLVPVNLVDFPVAVLVRSARLLSPTTLRVVLASRVARGRGAKLPSLLMDLRAGKQQTEIGSLNGAVAKQAAALGVQAPTNAKLAQVIEGIAAGTIAWDGYRGQPERLLARMSA